MYEYDDKQSKNDFNTDRISDPDSFNARGKFDMSDFQMPKVSSFPSVNDNKFLDKLLKKK